MDSTAPRPSVAALTKLFESIELEATYSATIHVARTEISRPPSRHVVLQVHEYRKPKAQRSWSVLQQQPRNASMRKTPTGPGQIRQAQRPLKKRNANALKQPKIPPPPTVSVQAMDVDSPPEQQEAGCKTPRVDHEELKVTLENYDLYAPPTPYLAPRTTIPGLGVCIPDDEVQPLEEMVDEARPVSPKQSVECQSSYNSICTTPPRLYVSPSGTWAQKEGSTAGEAFAWSTQGKTPKGKGKGKAQEEEDDRSDSAQYARQPPIAVFPAFNINKAGTFDFSPPPMFSQPLSRLQETPIRRGAVHHRTQAAATLPESPCITNPFINADSSPLKLSPPPRPKAPQPSGIARPKPPSTTDEDILMDHAGPQTSHPFPLFLLPSTSNPPPTHPSLPPNSPRPSIPLSYLLPPSTSPFTTPNALSTKPNLPPPQQHHPVDGRAIAHAELLHAADAIKPRTASMRRSRARLQDYARVQQCSRALVFSAVNDDEGHPTQKMLDEVAGRAAWKKHMAAAEERNREGLGGEVFWMDQHTRYRTAETLMGEEGDAWRARGEMEAQMWAQTRARERERAQEQEQAKEQGQRRRKRCYWKRLFCRREGSASSVAPNHRVSKTTRTMAGRTSAVGPTTGGVATGQGLARRKATKLQKRRRARGAGKRIERERYLMEWYA
ncbi:hypothetical protein IQ07DRAFT_665855 [Pyrenochaeta sp. DS3sAY3a]|nr:hypothetical protein IQ07DRAFT_665855 [Pyrenochaeta sp. DS3sAY3a]